MASEFRAEECALTGQGAQILAHLRPVDHIPPGLNIRRALVLDPSGTIDRKTRQIRSLGTKVEIDEKQAKIVRTIFSMYASGHGLKSIAINLNEQGIEPPRKAVQAKRRNSAPTWSPFTIRSILHNVKYSGDWSWNRKQWYRKRKTGKRVYRDRPATDLVEYKNPDLAIVNPDLWELVRERIKINADKYAQGVRTPRRNYLLSGLLQCGLCGANLTIVYGREPGKAKYGCAFNWRRGKRACTNNVLISRVEIEERILGAIENEVLHPRYIRRIVALVNDKLKEAIPKIEGIREPLVRVSEKLEIEINNLVQAVAEGGNNSGHLVDAIKRKESELADVCSKLEATNDKKPLGELKIDTQYALKWMKNLGELMKVDVIRARDGIAKILGTLTATPSTHNGVPGILLVGRPRLEGILGIVSASSTSNGSGGRI